MARFNTCDLVIMVIAMDPFNVVENIPSEFPEPWCEADLAGKGLIGI